MSPWYSVATSVIARFRERTERLARVYVQDLLLHRLTAADAAKCAKDGYVHYHKPVFTPAKFARLNSIFEEHLAGIGGARTDTPHFRDARLLEFLLTTRSLTSSSP
jgi:hypothetical protein